MRAIAVCLAAVLGLAFAPAPFPKSGRPAGGEDDLKKLQGKWLRVLSNGRPESPTQLTITADRQNTNRSYSRCPGGSYDGGACASSPYSPAAPSWSAPSDEGPSWLCK